MATVTDADLQEIKDLIASLRQEVKARFDEVNARFDEVDARFNEVDKKFVEVSANLNVTNAKVEALDKRMTDGFSNLDKRITNQEFIYRSVFIGIIASITAGVMALVSKYVWSQFFV